MEASIVGGGAGLEGGSSSAGAAGIPETQTVKVCCQDAAGTSVVVLCRKGDEELWLRLTAGSVFVSVAGNEIPNSGQEWHQRRVEAARAKGHRAKGEIVPYNPEAARG